MHDDVLPHPSRPSHNAQPSQAAHQAQSALKPPLAASLFPAPVLPELTASKTAEYLVMVRHYLRSHLGEVVTLDALLHDILRQGAPSVEALRAAQTAAHQLLQKFDGVVGTMLSVSVGVRPPNYTPLPGDGTALSQ